MTGKQYMEVQVAIIQIGKRASQLDLEGFLATLSKADSIAPMLDPTLYRKAQDNLNAIKHLAEKIKEVSDAHHAVVNAVMKTAVAEHMVKAEVIDVG